MITAQDIITEARTWIGVPFRHQGRSRHGVDCIGLVLEVRRALGPLPESMLHAPTYQRQVRESTLLDLIAERFERATMGTPGSVVLIKWPMAPHPTHIAICAGETIIHTYANGPKVVCEVGFRRPWSTLAHSAYLLPGVKYP